MGIRHLAGTIVVAASVTIGAPSAPAAEDVVFPPNTEVEYCGVDELSDVNGSGLASGLRGDTGNVFDLHADTRTSVRADAYPTAINDAGLVVGMYGDRFESFSGFVFDVVTGEFTVVDPALGSDSELVAINEQGVALGNYFTEGEPDALSAVFTYDTKTGEVSDLGTFGEVEATAADISDTGRIVGVRGTSGPHPMTGFWHDPATGETEALRGLGGTARRPSAISGSLVVGSDVGVPGDPNGGEQAFVEDLSSGTVDVIAPSSVGYSNAFDVNADGIVVGEAFSTSAAPPAEDYFEAFAYDAITKEYFPLDPHIPAHHWLRAVNDGGLSVGSFLYTGGFSYSCPTVVQLQLPPRPPASPSVELFGTTARLSWGATFDGYGDVTYVVRFDGLEVARIPAPLTSVALPDVPCAGGTYTVTAENAAGASAPSEGAVLVARSCTPALPAVPVPATPTFTG